MPRKSTDRPPAPDRPERLALNLWDLQHLHPTVQSLLAGRFDRRQEALVWVDRSRTDETAVPILGPLLDAACLVDVVRAEAIKGGGDPIRAYIYRKTWTRLPAGAVLTQVENGQPVLCPEWFPGVVECAPYAPPPPKAVTF